MADLIHQVKALDPTPVSSDLPAGLWSADAVLRDIDERTGNMQTQERPLERVTIRPPRPRRRPLFALAAAFVAVVAAGVLVAVLSGDGADDASGPDSSPAEVIAAMDEAWAAGDTAAFEALFAPDSNFFTAELRLATASPKDLALILS